jgi:PKD repeat protein
LSPMWTSATSIDFIHKLVYVLFIFFESPKHNYKYNYNTIVFKVNQMKNFILYYNNKVGCKGILTVEDGAYIHYGYGILPPPHAPVARFDLDPIAGTVPLSVQFLDKSFCYPTTWLWDFGDGFTSDLQDPVHIYESPGSFTITLSASNDAGMSPKTNYIVISELEV